MSSWLEVRQLLALGSHRQTLCERELHRTLGACRGIDGQLEALAGQCAGLHKLLDNSRLQGSALSYAQLTGHLRQGSVLRRQLAELELERSRLQQERERHQASAADCQAQRGVLQAKQHKYQLMQQRLLRERRHQRLCADDAEIEDLLTSRRPCH